MQKVFAMEEAGRRKLKFLYRQSGITTRYSSIPDYSLSPADWQFYPPTENIEPFPDLDKRMQWYQRHAADLSMAAIRNCGKDLDGITHLVTVSCTGMSAPGLDLELLDLLKLAPTTFHTSVNFMGCYAAIHAMKIADAFCKADKKAKVLVVCTELCTLHFQKDPTPDSITSSMLFSDGAAALLITGDDAADGLRIDSFHSMVASRGKKDMAWELSSKGFLMTLSGYVPNLVEEDFNGLVNDALVEAGLVKSEITHWCIHPGGKRILEAVHKSLGFSNGQLQHCFDVLNDFGNMSSPTVLFVLQKIIQSNRFRGSEKIFGAAFGPGISMETFVLSV
jgi:predicted naringenin-chalcone synthase